MGGDWTLEASTGSIEATILNLTSYEGLLATTIGTSADETLTGTASIDVLIGLAGSDILIGAAGNDWISGSDGVDTAQYSGAYTSYTIAKSTSAMDRWV